MWIGRLSSPYFESSVVEVVSVDASGSRRYLIVKYGESKAALALGQLDDVRLRAPHGQARQRLQTATLELAKAWLCVCGGGRC